MIAFFHHRSLVAFSVTLTIGSASATTHLSLPRRFGPRVALAWPTPWNQGRGNWQPATEPAGGKTGGAGRWKRGEQRDGRRGARGGDRAVRERSAAGTGRLHARHPGR